MLYDVIVVGGGLAGLTAASKLVNRSVCIVERDERVGGRVYSQSIEGMNVDLGACFAFDPRIIPVPLVSDPGSLIKEHAPLGISEGGQIVFADTPKACLEKMNLKPGTWNTIVDFALDNSDANEMVDRHAYALLNALHHQIHLGELADYAPQAQRDGLKLWYPNHWNAGNGVIVESLKQSISARYYLNAEVSSVEETPSDVEVRFTQNNDDLTLKGRAVVLATPADVVKKILSDSGSQKSVLRNFLDSVSYVRLSVVAMVLSDQAVCPEFRCIVCVDKTLTMVIQQRDPVTGKAVLLCYYGEKSREEIANLSNESLVELTCDQLVAMGLNGRLVKSLNPVSVKHWVPAGTVISADYLQNRKESYNKLSSKIYLAGDYLTGMGYGINDAVFSGLAAADLVQEYLE
jgi:protoporphyrinogen oxidase